MISVGWLKNMVRLQQMYGTLSSQTIVLLSAIAALVDLTLVLGFPLFLVAYFGATTSVVDLSPVTAALGKNGVVLMFLGVAIARLFVLHRINARLYTEGFEVQNHIAAASLDKYVTRAATNAIDGKSLNDKTAVSVSVVDPKLFTYNLYIPTLYLLQEFLVVFYSLALFLIVNFSMTLIVTCVIVSSTLVIAVRARKVLEVESRRKDTAEKDRIEFSAQAGLLSKELLLYRAAADFILKFSELSRVANTADLTLFKINSFTRVYLEFLIFCAIAVYLLLISAFQLPGSVTLEMMMLFTFMAFRLLPSASRISTSFPAVKFGLPVLEGLVELLPASPPATAAPQNTVPASAAPFHSLRVENLSFSYSPKAHVLRNVEFTAKTGEVIGIVGASGSGKSTFVNLLLGLLSTKSGRIEFLDSNNQFITSPRIAYVPQKNTIFSAPLRDNILFRFHPQMSANDDASLQHALDKAGLSHLIATGVLELDTFVNASNVSFSGGQAQRVNIARALLRRPDVLIMDEPSSALDSEIEDKVFSDISRMESRPLIIIISHSEGVLKYCDRIYRLNAGQLVRIMSEEVLDEDS
jgi:ABC-type bacteriocin/lantibiotic exporter with double-glycine peptidase domain